MDSGSKSRRHSPPLNPHLAMYAWLGLMALTIALAGAVGGILLERKVLDEDAVPSQDFADVDAVGNLIEDNYYYRPEEGEDQAGFQTSLERNAINGMLSGLDDEYTRYLVPDEAQIASDELTGEYGGIGATLASDGQTLLVIEVDPGSPAEQAGIQAGDQITRIDNRPIDANALPGQQGDLRGPVGSTVNLMITRADADPVTVAVTREAIVIHAVTSQMLTGTSYYWIKISIFGNRTTAELDAALAQAQAEGATGIILDLRGNGGGWVTAAQETIGRFVSETAGVALYEDDVPGPGGEVSYPILSPDSGPTTLPTIVLVDSGTASAAEIVAGALRDYDRALIIGEPTFGKGSVQRIFDFPDGASLRVTVAEWFTPSKGRLQGEGIKPDLQLSGAAGTATSGDPYLMAASTLLDKGQSKPSDRIPQNDPATPDPQ